MTNMNWNYRVRLPTNSNPNGVRAAAKAGVIKRLHSQSYNVNVT